MGSTWVDEEAASNMRPCQNIDPTKLKITNDPGILFYIFTLSPCGDSILLIGILAEFGY